MRPLIILTLCGAYALACAGCGLSLGTEARARLDRKVCPGQTSDQSGPIANVVNCTTAAIVNGMTGGAVPMVVNLSTGIGPPCSNCKSQKVTIAEGTDQHGNQGRLMVCANCKTGAKMEYKAIETYPGGASVTERAGQMGDMVDSLHTAAQGAPKPR